MITPINKSRTRMKHIMAVAKAEEEKRGKRGEKDERHHGAARHQPNPIRVNKELGS